MSNKSPAPSAQNPLSFLNLTPYEVGQLVADALLSKGCPPMHLAMTLGRAFQSDSIEAAGFVAACGARLEGRA